METGWIQEEYATGREKKNWKRKSKTLHDVLEPKKTGSICHEANKHRCQHQAVAISNPTCRSFSFILLALSISFSCSFSLLVHLLFINYIKRSSSVGFFHFNANGSFPLISIPIQSRSTFTDSIDFSFCFDKLSSIKLCQNTNNNHHFN